MGLYFSLRDETMNLLRYVVCNYDFWSELVPSFSENLTLFLSSTGTQETPVHLCSSSSERLTLDDSLTLVKLMTMFRK